MAENLTKTITLLEMCKAKHFIKDIAKSLKVERMLVWCTMRRFNETGDMKNRQGQAQTSVLIKSTQKLRRNLSRSLRDLVKEVNVSMSNILYKYFKTYTYKHQKKSVIHKLCGEITNQMPNLP